MVPVPSVGTGRHGQGEAVCTVCSTREHREGARSGRPQPHLPSMSPLKVPVARLLDVQMTQLIEAPVIRQEQKSPSRCTWHRLPLILCCRGRWARTPVRPQIHPGSLEDIRARSKITRGAFTLWGARSCAMLCVHERSGMACASDAISAGLHDLQLGGTVCVRKTGIHKSSSF